MATNYNNFLGGTKSVIHLNANDVVVVVGNNTVSNLTSNSTENVHSCSITSAKFGSQGGTWKIFRSNSSVNTVVGVFSGTGYVPLHDTPITIESTKNLKIELEGASNGFIIIEVHKQGGFV